MRVVSGTFKLPASDIDLYFGIGFIPDWVKMYSMDANEQFVHWTIHMMHHASALGGIEWDDAGDVTPNTFEIGVAPWRGGNAVTAAQYTAGNCLTWDRLDYSKASNHDPVTYNDITKWTFVTGQTGYWDQMCNTTYVGVGSMIWIASGNSAPKRYVIAALTGNGEASAEVTLSEASVLSGDITKITNMYDMRVMNTGKIMPAGFWLDSTADLLTAVSAQAFFEAGTYDRS